MEIVLIEYSYNFGRKLQQKYKFISFESHDIGLEYTYNLKLPSVSDGLRNIKIELRFNINEEKYKLLSHCDHKDGIDVIFYDKDLSFLMNVDDQKERQLLLLDYLQEVLLRLAENYNWQKSQFQRAYDLTRKKIESGEELKNFYEYITGSSN